MKPEKRLIQICEGWQPLLFDRMTVETLRSEEYSRFIQMSVLVPGCLLLLSRRGKHSGWPYVDTKFNPNTGQDLPSESYGMVYAWILGRGSEALDDHLRYLPRLDGLNASEKTDIRETFLPWIDSMTGAIAALVKTNLGRMPFRVNREGGAVDTMGMPVVVNPDVAGAGDVFGAKGLLSSSDPALQQLSQSMLRRAADLIRRDQVENEQAGVAQGANRGQGMRMLMQGAGMCVVRKALDPAARREALTAAAACMTEVLDSFYDPDTALFSEYINQDTGARGAYLDPGHANEFAGLGLGLIEALETSEWPAHFRDLIVRAKRELPRLFLKSTVLGFNPDHPGMYKAVDNRTGEALNTDMPWWNLPETMRTAVRACAVATSEVDREACLKTYVRCHNAYFSQYLNRANGLFPVQTLNGVTGQVADVVPAIPEGDPLYHANGAFLDILEVVRRL